MGLHVIKFAFFPRWSLFTGSYYPRFDCIADLLTSSGGSRFCIIGLSRTDRWSWYPRCTSLWSMLSPTRCILAPITNVIIHRYINVADGLRGHLSNNWKKYMKKIKFHLIAISSNKNTNVYIFFAQDHWIKIDSTFF